MAIEKIEKQPYANDLINTINKTIDAINTLNGTAKINNSVDNKISKVIDSAPKTFDTLKEIASWIKKEDGEEGFDAAARIVYLENRWDGNKLVFPNGNKLWIE